MSRFTACSGLYQQERRDGPTHPGKMRKDTNLGSMCKLNQNWTMSEWWKKILWDFQLVSVGSRSDSELLCLSKSEPDLWIFGGLFTAEPRFSWMSKAREVLIFFNRGVRWGGEGRVPFCCYNINSILHTAACMLPCAVNKTGNIF